MCLLELQVGPPRSFIQTAKGGAQELAALTNPQILQFQGPPDFTLRAKGSLDPNYKQLQTPPSSVMFDLELCQLEAL